jgi:hypothetical protein
LGRVAQGLEGAHKDRRSARFLVAHQIEQHMHTIAQVKVYATSWPKHGGIARRSATRGVAGGVVLGQVGLDLCEPAAPHSQAPHYLADKMRGHLIGWPSEEFSREHPSRGQIVAGAGESDAVAHTPILAGETRPATPWGDRLHARARRSLWVGPGAGRRSAEPAPAGPVTAAAQCAPAPSPPGKLWRSPPDQSRRRRSTPRQRAG